MTNRLWWMLGLAFGGVLVLADWFIVGGQGIEVKDIGFLIMLMIGMGMVERELAIIREKFAKLERKPTSK